MTGKWKRAIGSKPATFSGARPRSSAIRRRRNSLYLAMQELECRTLLVEASETTPAANGTLETVNGALETATSAPVAAISVTGATIEDPAQINPILHFHGNGNGRGVYWRFAAGRMIPPDRHSLDTRSATNRHQCATCVSRGDTGHPPTRV
jgi:hypothetical protein